jgi:hypothetical protein
MALHLIVGLLFMILFMTLQHMDHLTHLEVVLIECGRAAESITQTSLIRCTETR